MVTHKYQGFPQYRYAQIHLKNNDKHREDPHVDTYGTPANKNDLPNENYVIQNQGEYEVNYENGVTDLYDAISNSQWDRANEILRSKPKEARTWVVRYKEDDTKGVMWRFLPLHSACARQPPHSIVASLIQAYPEAAGCCDDQGMYPLHYASGNQASAEVIRLLLEAFPHASSTSDPNGMLPIHYMAQWGPSETKAIDTLLASNQQTNARDDEGNTPLQYAEEGDYQFRQEMIAALRKGPISIMKKPNTSQLSTRRILHSNVTPSKSVPMILTTPNLSSSNVSKLDDVSVMSNFPTKKSYTNLYIEPMTPNNTTNKTVNRLQAQINKLKADYQYHAAEHEENLTNLREEHEQAMEELKAKILKTIDENAIVKNDIQAKTDYANYVQERIKEVEKDINHFKDQNQRLENEIARHEEEQRMEKSKAETAQTKIKTLSSKMNLMIEDQRRIEKSLRMLENDIKEESEKRMLKLKELYDEEMKYIKESIGLTHVYGAGGPTILAALNQQKQMMENCALVLSECVDDEKENPAN